ncbi:MAG: ATP-grasp domain-containing protein, partial [Bdellovibrionales bacterium]|nr:ATP-grasp domain-containing protein [Bdellovibrionales bacterium]
MPTKKKYQKILIANRGEIAVRVLRTCKELGISTVGVHSSVDETSLHVKLSDESVCIGPAKSSLSYLNIPNILSATEITESDAIHPGFGFLSESSIFAEYCMKYNVDFIGPNIECIKKMGDKIRSKQIAQNAGLKVLTSVKVEGKNEQEILKEVKCLGLPVLIKASAGGGGKGMERIDNISKIMPTIKRLKKEAKDSFGDDTLFIEKYIQNPRHIEVQILADKYGNVIHLGERDCTIQKSYQKIIEESPCPIITNEIRNELCSSAVKLAKYVNYDSVGTVEFLFDQDDREFYFMEMNTRIQVEHPITEVLTGIDLIAEQIKISQGEKLKI